MNLPEGFLFSVLQEQLGPHLGASPLNLLAVVGRNTIGRVKVAAPRAEPTRLAVSFELAKLLHGENSEGACVDLVSGDAVSGVSGMGPRLRSLATFTERAKET